MWPSPETPANQARPLSPRDGSSDAAGLQRETQRESRCRSIAVSDELARFAHEKERPSASRHGGPYVASRLHSLVKARNHPKPRRLLHRRHFTPGVQTIEAGGLV